jgi:hypothetical protein
MTKDELIKMAGDAGIEIDGIDVTSEIDLQTLCNFAEAVAEQERYACAVIAFNADTYIEAALAIRARGDGMEKNA